MFDKFDLEQEQAQLAEKIKDSGYRLYFQGETMKDRLGGMELIILGAWLREKMFPLVPPSLSEYRVNYISANMEYWDKEIMKKMAKKYGTVTDPKIKPGRRTWIS